ncbi:hypothetical protein [Streptomyces sp. NPDC059970]|uniref:hypothetical protein n=1 Tax=Streptomyces sp. NPDC059970 TaxID=3347019 RepID=UPI003683DBFC
MGENEMSIFGVSEAEEEVYRHFLRNPGTATDDLHLLLHTDPRVARSCIDRLQELGLLHPEGSDLRIFPTDPEVALARLIDLRLHSLHQELQRVTRSRHVIDGLRAEQGARRPPPPGIEQLEGLAQIRNRIDDLAFFARDEILSVEPYTKLSPENIARSRPLDLRCLRRGVGACSVMSACCTDHGSFVQSVPATECPEEHPAPYGHESGPGVFGGTPRGRISHPTSVVTLAIPWRSRSGRSSCPPGTPGPGPRTGRRRPRRRRP